MFDLCCIPASRPPCTFERNAIETSPSSSSFSPSHLSLPPHSLLSLSPTHPAPHFSLCLSPVEFKKSYENDSQSSDNVNFLRVGWSNKQLTTLKPLLSEIEYLQDQHLLLTVKSLDGYESYGIKRVFMFVLWLCKFSEVDKMILFLLV